MSGFFDADTNIKIDTAVELILEAQEYNKNESPYGCALRKIEGNVINCKDSCRECWSEYLKSLN